jgi:hypothetical protein
MRNLQKPVLAIATTCLVAGLALADDTEKGKSRRGQAGLLDGGVMLKRLDANKDGKLSLEEFKKLGELGRGRGQDRPELLDRLFQRLDADGDGSLSAEELKKMGEGLRARRPAKP